MNTPTGNSVTTAEHALALLFSLARRSPRPRLDAGRQVGESNSGARALRQNARRHRLGHIGRSSPIAPWASHECRRLRPVPHAPSAPRRSAPPRWRSTRSGARRRDHRAHAAHGTDVQRASTPHRSRKMKRAFAHQLRARGHLDEAALLRGPESRAFGGRRARRIRRRAARRNSALRCATRDLHAAPRGVDRRGARARRDRDRRAGRTISCRARSPTPSTSPASPPRRRHD